MNRNCHVDIFRIKGKIWLRCAWNGSLNEIKDNITTLCPSCNRPIEIGKDYLEPKTRQVTQVWYQRLEIWIMIPQ